MGDHVAVHEIVGVEREEVAAAALAQDRADDPALAHLVAARAGEGLFGGPWSDSTKRTAGSARSAQVGPLVAADHHGEVRVALVEQRAQGMAEQFLGARASRR